jgi:hypothetical protein
LGEESQETSNTSMEIKKINCFIYTNKCRSMVSLRDVMQAACNDIPSTSALPDSKF